jgi:hypothetical protein
MTRRFIISHAIPHSDRYVSHNYRGAKNKGQIEGLFRHLVDSGLSILQYVEDTILFMEDGLEKSRNVKLILSPFQQLFGLKINFHKSELFCLAMPKMRLPYLLICFPNTYFGIWIQYRRLTNSSKYSRMAPSVLRPCVFLSVR